MITIRPIKNTDFPQITQIEFESFSDPYPLHLFQYLAHIEPALFLVAVEDKALLGYIIGETEHRFESLVGHLLSLAVRQEKRRKGIGHQLIEALIEIFKKQGCRELVLEVRVSNYSAKMFYQKQGFREIRRSSKYYDNGEDALIMELNLEERL
ncbi:MAG: ribosomal protein S18-alanine N-acetyltransferase [Candidatus Hermodarchaeia archaeon]|jgi:ribosomal-protein-alanine N-acetyltransferase